jgi:hypothetical protein
MSRVATLSHLRRHGPWRRVIRPLLLLPLAAVLAGCFQAEMSIEVAPDGTAEIVILAALDVTTPGLTERSDQEDLTGPELFAELGVADVCASAPGGLVQFSAEPFVKGTLRGVRCTASGIDVTDLDTTSQNGTRLRIASTATESGEAWEFSLTLPEQLTNTQDSETASFLDISIALTAPGVLAEHNGSTVQGSTVRWDLSSPQTAPSYLYAFWDPAPQPTVQPVTSAGGTQPDGSFSTLTILLMGVLTATGSVLAGLAARRVLRTPWRPGRARSPRPGWYKDPASPTGRRFWDGSAWTDKI